MSLIRVLATAFLACCVVGPALAQDEIKASGGEFFRYGYGAKGPMVRMQSAGTDATGAAQGTLEVSQQIDLASGGPADTSAALHSSISVNGGPVTNYWAAGLSAYVHGLRDPTGSPDQSQHGALYTHLVKTTDKVPGGIVPDGRRLADGWAQWWVIQDRTGLPSSKGGASVGLEFDWFGNGPDDAPGKARYGRQVVLNRFDKSDASKPFEVGYGDYWNSHTGGAQDTFFNVVSAYYAGWTVAAIDLSQGTGARANPYQDPVNRAVDIKMRNGGKLSFDGDGVSGSYLTHQPGGLEYWSAGARVARLTDAGGLALGSAALAVGPGSIGLQRPARPAGAPGAAGMRLEVACGSMAGTARLVAYAGTSSVPTIIADNLGQGVAGC